MDGAATRRYGRMAYSVLHLHLPISGTPLHLQDAALERRDPGRRQLTAAFRRPAAFSLINVGALSLRQFHAATC